MSAQGNLASGVKSILDGMAEPVALLTLDLVVRYQNNAFKGLCGTSVLGIALTDLAHAGEDDLHAYLQQSSGSGSPLLGTIQLATRQGARHRVQARRVNLEDGPSILIILDSEAEGRFIQLSREVAQLNKENAERRNAEAVLKEALRERGLLMRELQHRVKNNLHMLGSLLRRAEREIKDVDARAAVRDVSTKLTAISAVQGLLSGSERPDAVNSLTLLKAVTDGAISLASDEVDCRVDGEHFALKVDEATSLALIINELVTNAVKYGRPETGVACVVVSIFQSAQAVELTIHDNGPGFEFTKKEESTSGLGLVIGLVRQMRGTLTVDVKNGTAYKLHFPLTMVFYDAGK